MRFVPSLLVLLLGSVAHAAVPVVDNPREAPHQVTITYEEAWRVGADDEADFLFGVLSRVTADPDGNLYFLDTQQQQVFKFSSEGDYLGLVSRQGEGPGEIDRCYIMRNWNDEGLVLLHSFPGRATLVDYAGSPRGRIDFSMDLGDKGQSFLSCGNLAVRDGHLLASGRIMTWEGAKHVDTYFLSSFSQEGEEILRYGEQAQEAYDFSRTIVVEEAAEFIGFRRWALGRDGQWYTAPERDAYLIEVRDAENNLLREIRRDFPRHKRTAEQKEAAKNDYAFGGNVELPEIRFNIDDYDPPIIDLGCVGDELMVSCCHDVRNLPDGIARRYDVFDLEGNLIEQRSHAVPMNKGEDSLTILPDGRAVRITNRRSAHAAATADLNIQVGDKKVEGSDDAILLEVIVYAPVRN